MDATKKWLAERKLLFSKKGQGRRRELTIRISEPFLATESNSSFTPDGVISGCHVSIDGIDEPSFDVFGMDSLQAINIASDIEALVERLSQEYDFYWRTGEPYFDE